jgi:hypothetical protein
MRSKCHFNKKCLLYHPEGLPPDELHPWILKLQQSFDAMVVEISDLKQVVRILKTSFLLTLVIHPNMQTYQHP